MFKDSDTFSSFSIDDVSAAKVLRKDARPRRCHRR
jgi:hypothetical protein